MIDETSYYSDATYAPGGRPGHAVSPVDLSVYLRLSTGPRIKFATLHMISVSSHRDKFPVSVMSRVEPLGYTKGHRMVAGTLVFSVFDRAAFAHALRASDSVAAHTSTKDRQSGGGQLALLDMDADALPPFDVDMVYTTDGRLCYEGLRGVEILDQGTIRSMEMMSLQESYSFMARSKIPLQPFDLYMRSQNSPDYRAKVDSLNGIALPQTFTFQAPVPAGPATATYSPSSLALTLTATGASGAVPLAGVSVSAAGQSQVSTPAGCTFAAVLPGTYPLVVSPGTGTGSDGRTYRVRPLSTTVTFPGSLTLDVGAPTPFALPTTGVVYD